MRSASNRMLRWFYNRIAFAYEPVLALGARLGLSHELPIRRQVLPYLDLPAGARVLELGCGTAANRPYLPADISYLGLDFSMGMLRRGARQTIPVSLLCADTRSVPLAPASFHLVLAMGLLQHLADPALALHQMARLAQPDGRILIIDELGPLGRRVGTRDVARRCASLIAWRLRAQATLGEYLLFELEPGGTPPPN